MEGISLSEVFSDPVMRGEKIRRVLEAVEEAALKVSIRVAAALVDRTGRLIGLQVMPGTFLTSDRAAIAKAFAAANFGASTRELRSRIPEDTRTELLSVDGRLSFVVGGVPVSVEGQVIGGLGVSGGLAELDERVGLMALASVEGWDVPNEPT